MIAAAARVVQLAELICVMGVIWAIVRDFRFKTKPGHKQTLGTLLDSCAPVLLWTGGPGLAQTTRMTNIGAATHM